MPKKTGRWLELILHIIFWMGLALLVFKSGEDKLVVEMVESEDKIIDTKQLLLITYLTSAAIFYGNVLVLYPRLFKKEKHLLYSLLLLLWSFLVVWLEWTYLKSQFLPISSSLFRDNLINHAVFLLFSVTYMLIKNKLITDRAQQAMREAHLVNEMNFLKSQFNPHFLFNSINNIFSIAQKNGDDEVAQYISDLSKVMRYSLYESNELRVPLQKEINFIKSYVEMSKLKFSNEDLVVDFQINGDPEQQQIAPLLLVPLIENAFKHSPALSIKSDITIRLDIGAGLLNMLISNNYSTGSKRQNEPGGIGLNNLGRRLELLYEDRHRFEIKEEKDRFEVTLEIPLNE